MYAWLVVFVLPINSAINPIIYTLASPTGLRTRALKSVADCFLRLKCGVFKRHRQNSTSITMTAADAIHYSSSIESHVSDLTSDHCSNKRTSASSEMSLTVLKPINGSHSRRNSPSCPSTKSDIIEMRHNQSSKV